MKEGSVIAFGIAFAYIAALFLIQGFAARTTLVGTGIVTRAHRALIPGYAALAAMVAYAIGVVAAVSPLGVSTVSVTVTLVLFSVSAFGRLLHGARLQIATARTDLLESIDALQLALDLGDSIDVRTTGLCLSRTASAKRAMGIRLLSAPATEVVDALISHIVGVPLPHVRPLDVIAHGEFRSLTVSEGRLILQEGCTRIRTDLVHS
ncbi:MULTISPECIES: hypothetical protein [unclassified Curtobacterium]|uniref:hypothetical protein n=1 Tax=unclassified Curtobacterium TaxID=257496 RepID=UPI00226B9672|nr:MULTISPECIES: hypothetical protein [unclassified Curtobacterium]